MQPEHEAFLIDHMKKMGFFFIIDRLKDGFPDLSHEQACAIYEEFKRKHADDEVNKKADAQMKEIGGAMAEQIEKVIRKRVQ